MLILTRRIDESVRIGDEIAVKIIGIEGQRVRIGIEAPREIPVNREEIAERIERERRGDH